MKSDSESAVSFVFLDDRSSEETVVMPRSKPRKKYAKRATNGKQFAVACVAVCAISLAVSAAIIYGFRLTGPTKADAIADAQSHISELLISPSTAKFAWDSNVTRIGKNGYEVNTHVDSQNAFGAEVRSKWVVLLEYDASGKCKILDAAFEN